MPRNNLLPHLIGATILLIASSTALGRDQVLAVGSSTIFPFATRVAERIGSTTRFKTPQIEAWGSGGGIRLFCRGVGVDEPDIAFASREMAASEVEQCRTNGVTDIVGLRFGWDGIVVATPAAGPHLSLTLTTLYLALGKTVPDPTGEPRLVPNPYQRWNELDSTLPDAPIRVYGPPMTSGTRDMLIGQGLIPGCRSIGWLADLERSDPGAFRERCGTIREDGAYISTGENDNLIVRKVGESDHASGVFGFSYYDQNRDRIQASGINGVAPSFDTIYEHTYPLARPLYLYVKVAHLDSIPGLPAFITELVSERAVGEDGYLIDLGLIPLPETERAEIAERIERLTGGG